MLSYRLLRELTKATESLVSAVKSFSVPKSAATPPRAQPGGNKAAPIHAVGGGIGGDARTSANKVGFLDQDAFQRHKEWKADKWGWLVNGQHVKRHTHTLTIRYYVYIHNTVFLVYILVCVVAGYRVGGGPGEGRGYSPYWPWPRNFRRTLLNDAWV